MSDPRFARLVPADAPLRRLADGFVWAEGPFVAARRGRAPMERHPEQPRAPMVSADDRIDEFLRPSDFANGHTLDRDGTVLACEHGTRRVARYERDGRRTTVVDRYRGARLNSPNDVVVASDGGIWFTDPPYGIVSDREGHLAPPELPACYVFRFDPVTAAWTSSATTSSTRTASPSRPTNARSTCPTRHWARRRRQPPHPVVRRR